MGRVLCLCLAHGVSGWKAVVWELFAVDDAGFWKDRAAIRACLLESPPRGLPWFGDDDLGSQLFEEITRPPTYYLTRVERALLEVHAGRIADRVDGAGGRAGQREREEDALAARTRACSAGRRRTYRSTSAVGCSPRAAVCWRWSCPGWEFRGCGAGMRRAWPTCEISPRSAGHDRIPGKQFGQHHSRRASGASRRDRRDAAAGRPLPRLDRSAEALQRFSTPVTTTRLTGRRSRGFGSIISLTSIGASTATSCCTASTRGRTTTRRRATSRDTCTRSRTRR